MLLVIDAAQETSRDHVAYWQIDDHRGALAHSALRVDRSFVFFDNAQCEGQPETGSLALGLCREERVEDLCERLSVDSGARVRHSDGKIRQVFVSANL